MSRAARLRSQALKFALSDNQNLLTQVQLPARIAAELARVVQTTPVKDRKATSVLLVGGCTPGLPAALAAERPGRDLDMRMLKHPARAGTAGDEGTAEPDIPVSRSDLADYALDPKRLADALARHAPGDVASYMAFREDLARSRAQAPWIADESIDVLVQDFTANLLAREALRNALAESFRVLAHEGTLSLTALLADEPLAPDEPVAWGEGGALRHFPQETELLDMLQAAGFHGMTLQPLAPMPVLLIDKREVRAFAITAYKGTAGPCLDQGHAVIYRGPWREVSDDDGHVYRRGVRMAVCAKTYGVLQRAPYRDQFIGLPACDPPALDKAPVFDCNTPSVRDPRVTKGLSPLRAPAAVSTTEAASCCEPSTAGDCCGTDAGSGCC